MKAPSCSYERIKDEPIPYWVSEYGIFSEVEIPGYRPLRWATPPLSAERLKELFDASERNPGKFARLVEREHGIC